MKNLILKLNDKEFEALKKFVKIKYYDGGYDLYYKVPQGLNYDIQLQNRIVSVLSKVSKQARNLKNNKKEK